MHWKRRRFVFDASSPSAPSESPRMLARGVSIDTAEMPSTQTAHLRRQDPPMLAVDELILLLHTAAEIEHALMVQYLYAAYSLPEGAPHSRWAEVLRGIAREEMGHLMAIQNILLSLSAPLNFEREDYPFRSFYPFPLQLESASVASLARYVLAEMPDASAVPAELGFDLPSIQADAGTEFRANRVGALFASVAKLLLQLSDGTLNSDSLPLQAAPDEWLASLYNLLIAKAASVSDAASLIDQIARQGEGLAEPQSGPPSHFVRLFGIYRDAKRHIATTGEKHLGLAVPNNPSVRHEVPGYLHNPHARQLGGAFNTRYRWLLFSIAQHLGTEHGSTRSELRRWALEDMNTLRTLAFALRQTPQHDPVQFDQDGRPLAAGAPFELPYSLSLPTREVDRWRWHSMLATQHLAELDAINDSSSLPSDLREQVVARLARIAEVLEKKT